MAMFASWRLKENVTLNERKLTQFTSGTMISHIKSFMLTMYEKIWSTHPNAFLNMTKNLSRIDRRDKNKTFHTCCNYPFTIFTLSLTQNYRGQFWMRISIKGRCSKMSENILQFLQKIDTSLNKKLRIRFSIYWLKLYSMFRWEV